MAFDMRNMEPVVHIAFGKRKNVTASKEGTQICTRDEVLQSLQKVTVTRI